MEPNIIDLEQFKVIGLQTFGKPRESEYSTLWDTLFERSGEIQNIIDSVNAFGIDPYTKDFVTDDSWFYMAGCKVNSFDDLPTGMSVKTIPANTYAVFEYHGQIDSKFGEIFHYIYHEWIPNSGYILVASYDFEKYGANFRRPQSPDSVTEIYIPIKKPSS